MGLGNMARASRGEFEDVDEQALVGVTGVIGQHPLVDVLLSTLALQRVANSFQDFFRR